MTYSAEFLWVKSYMVLAVEAYYEKIGQISINYPENNCIWLQRPDWGTAVGCLVTQLFSTLCGPMDCSTPGFLVLHHLPEFAQTHVHGVGDAIQPSHLLSLVFIIFGSTESYFIFSIKMGIREGEVAQSCPTLCDPMNCSLPGSSVHGIFQAIVLEWIAISFSRGSSWPRDQTQVSCIVDRRFTVWATREFPI